MNFQKLFSKKFNASDKENLKETANKENSSKSNGLSQGRNINTPLFESPPVDKVAKSYTGYHTVTVKNIGQSAEEAAYDDVQAQAHQPSQSNEENLKQQQAQQLAEENLLCNYLNNIAEFSKLNDIDVFDDYQPQIHDGKVGPVSVQMNDNFIKCLLTSLEFLAHKWQLIDQKKYKYRFSKQNQSSKLVFEQTNDSHGANQAIGIPKDTYVQAYFSVGTMKLALSRVYMQTFDNKEILVEKEYALASAKLIQQFQKLLHLIKQKVEPVFFPEEQQNNKDSNEKKGFGYKLKTLFQNILSFGDDQDELNKEKEKQNLVRNKALIDELKQELKNFERMIRVFEMTYLDMIERLQELAKEKKLKSGPKEVQQEFKINQKEQVILHEQQYFDKEGNLIDRDARTIKHSVPIGNSNQRIGRSKQVISLVGNKNRNESNSGGRNGSGFNLSLSPATRVIIENDSVMFNNKLESVLKNKGFHNTSNIKTSSEKAINNLNTSNHDSTNYASSGIGNHFKENSFNMFSLQNINPKVNQNKNSNKHMQSTEAVQRKKAKAIEMQQDKENGGGRRSLGTVKQSSESSSKNLFQNSLSKLNEQQSCIFEDKSDEFCLIDKTRSNSKARTSNLIQLDKDDQQIYYPYTTKNKLYNNAGTKITINAIQAENEQPQIEWTDGKPLVDLNGTNQPNGNARNHRVNLFQSKLQTTISNQNEQAKLAEQKDIEIDAENCDVDSQGDEMGSNQMDEYKLFGNNQRELVKMSNLRPPLHNKDYNIQSNQKNSINGQTRSTGLTSAMSPNSNKASVQRISAIARSLEMKQHQNQTSGKQRTNQVRFSGEIKDQAINTFMSQNKRANSSIEESDLFIKDNSQEKIPFTSQKFDININNDQYDDQKKKIPSNSGDSCVQLDLGNSFTSSASSQKNHSTPQQSANPPSNHPFSSSLPPPSVALSSPLRKKRVSNSPSPSPNFLIEAAKESTSTIPVIPINVCKDFYKEDYIEKSVHVVECESLNVGEVLSDGVKKRQFKDLQEQELLEVMRVPVECGEGEIINDELDDDEEDKQNELELQNRNDKKQKIEQLNELSLLECSEQLSSGKKPQFLDFMLQADQEDRDQGGEAFPMTLSPSEVDSPLQESPADIENLQFSPENEDQIRSKIDNQYQRFQQNSRKKFKFKISRNSNLKKKIKVPIKQGKHQKVQNCAPVNSPVEEVNENMIRQENQAEVDDFMPSCEIELACNDQSVSDSPVLKQNLQNRNSNLAQDMFMIEERDEEVEEDTKENQTAENLKALKDSLEKSKKIMTKSMKSKDKRKKRDEATPVKDFGDFEQQDQDDLRLLSGRQKSPLKSLINFTISPSQQDSWLISCSKDGYCRQFESTSYGHKVESDQLCSNLSDSSSEADVLRINSQQTANYWENNVKYSFPLNELDKHGPLDSMTYSVSTVERSNVDKTLYLQQQIPVPRCLEEEESKSSQEMVKKQLNSEN